MKIFESLKKRSSVYELSKVSKLSDEGVLELVKEAVILTPSSFNSQSQRVAVLFGKESDKFWDLTRDALKAVAPKEGFEKTVDKLNKFKGQGTILFFVEMDTVKKLEAQFELYKDNFYPWAVQENAMLQLVIWSALSESGLGASLQHYNPVVDEAVYETFGIDRNWELVAQMPFGGSDGEISLKEKINVNERVKSFK